MRSAVVACRSCKASIVFVRSARGKTLPLDAAATATTDPAVILYSLEGHRIAHRAGEEVAGHVSHFTTCPDASAWSRRGDPRLPNQPSGRRAKEDPS